MSYICVCVCIHYIYNLFTANLAFHSAITKGHPFGIKKQTFWPHPLYQCKQILRIEKILHTELILQRDSSRLGQLMCFTEQLTLWQWK